MNQNFNKALEEICQRLIDVIDNSLDSEEDKNEVKNVIYELKEANTKSSIRSEQYRVCRRVNILRDYPDDKIKLYP